MGAGKPSKDIDINTASPEDWQQLPGIGAVRAQKIVRYRDKLGGFARIGQVAETYGLPDSIYQMIRAGLRLETPVFRMINLNTATAGEIYAHPYFSPQQARLIIAYREQHGRFGSAAEIGRIQAFTDKDWLERVLPYLTVQ
jgi:competence ComEA-like helix-hairpin-helix protein